MIGSVTYDEPDFQVQSHRARLNLREGLAQFLGNPARLTGEEGDVTARQLVYNRDRDHLVAAGEARVALPPKAGLPGPLMQSGDGPIRVESDEVRWNRDVDRTTFTGNVRAWRGRDLLLAEEMVVDRPTERLQASGKVRTIWHPAPPEEGKSKSAFQSGTLEVSADEFSYLGDEARLRYRGKVEVLDGPRTLRCGRTEIFLDEDDRMRRLECLESAYLSDRSQGRVIEGDRAVHDPVEGKIRVWGSPVKLKDERGSQLQGELVIYDLETENVELGRASEQEAAAEKGAGT